MSIYDPSPWPDHPAISDSVPLTFEARALAAEARVAELEYHLTRALELREQAETIASRAISRMALLLP